MANMYEKDGSLTPRLKGDIYWNKQKLMYRASTIGAEEYKRRKLETLTAGIFVKYKAFKAEKKDIKLIGNEFQEWPPTAAGEEIGAEAVARVMCKRDQLLSADLSDALLPVINRVTSLYFETLGFDLAKKEPITAADFTPPVDEFMQTRQEYEALFPSVSKTVSNDMPDDIHFREEIIKPTSLSAYENLIPENYVSQLKDNSLKATAYYRDLSSNEVYSVTITGVHDGWLELVWIAFQNEDGDRDEMISFVRSFLQNARQCGKYKGAFIELHKVEGTEESVRMLESAGMTVFSQMNNIYEFRFKDVLSNPTIIAASKKTKCSRVCDLDEKTKEEIEDHLYNTRMTVPVALPIPWKNYRQTLSFAYHGKLGTGLLLISGIGDTLVVELLYASNPIVTAALLGAAINEGRLQLSADQKFLVPIVIGATRPIIKKLVKDPVRGEIEEAVIWF